MGEAEGPSRLGLMDILDMSLEARRGELDKLSFVYM